MSGGGRQYPTKCLAALYGAGLRVIGESRAWWGSLARPGPCNRAVSLIRCDFEAGAERRSPTVLLLIEKMVVERTPPP